MISNLIYLYLQPHITTITNSQKRYNTNIRNTNVVRNVAIVQRARFIGLPKISIL